MRKQILALGCNELWLWKIENFWGAEILGIPVRKRGLILTLSSGISLRSSNFCIVTANIPGWFRDTGDWWQVRRPSMAESQTDRTARQCLGINDYLPSVATFQPAESQVKLFSSAAIDGWPSTDRRVISDQLGQVFLPPDAGSLRSGHCHQHKLALVSLTSKIAFQG